MYCGHARLCVCLSICLCECVYPRPYFQTTAQTRMQLGGVVEAAP